ncbi:MAG: zinc-ribbon domain-containing protein [Myxococcales bacterium]|nr:zinc-ribbon domain-containing protein [Myxococcales bacterium]
MKISCPACNAKYRIPDERVRGKNRVFRIKCKKCTSEIRVRGIATEQDVGRTTMPFNLEMPDTAPATPQRVWFAGIEGKQVGPLTEQEVLDHIAAGRLSGDDLVWRKGFGAWTAVREVSPFQAKVNETGATDGEPTRSPRRAQTLELSAAMIELLVKLDAAQGAEGGDGQATPDAAPPSLPSAEPPAAEPATAEPAAATEQPALPPAIPAADPTGERPVAMTLKGPAVPPAAAASDAAPALPEVEPAPAATTRKDTKTAPKPAGQTAAKTAQSGAQSGEPAESKTAAAPEDDTKRAAGKPSIVVKPATPAAAAKPGGGRRKGRGRSSQKGDRKRVTSSAKVVLPTQTAGGDASEAETKVTTVPTATASKPIASKKAAQAKTGKKATPTKPGSRKAAAKKARPASGKAAATAQAASKTAAGKKPAAAQKKKKDEGGGFGWLIAVVLVLGLAGAGVAIMRAKSGEKIKKPAEPTQVAKAAKPAVEAPAKEAAAPTPPTPEPAAEVKVPAPIGADAGTTGEDAGQSSDAGTAPTAPAAAPDADKKADKKAGEGVTGASTAQNAGDKPSKRSGSKRRERKSGDKAKPPTDAVAQPTKAEKQGEDEIDALLRKNREKTRPVAAAPKATPAPKPVAKPAPKTAAKDSIDILLEENRRKAAAKQKEEARKRALAAKRAQPAPPAVGPTGPGGKLTQKQVNKIALAAKGRIMDCYMDHGDVDGGRVTFKVRVYVTASGSVHNARVTGNNGSGGLGACIVKTVKSLRFPQSNGGTKKYLVRYTVGS